MFRLPDRWIEPSFSGCESPGNPARDFPLKAHDLHVWIVDVRRILAPDGELTSLLSKDEFQRWRRFHFPGDRRRFLVARSLLRTLLGRYLAADPQSIRFEYNQYGKPGLRGEFLSFNLSHSHNLILYGLALHEALGVDVERINPDFGTREIAERFFSPMRLRNCVACRSTSRYWDFSTVGRERKLSSRPSGVVFPFLSIVLT